MKYFAHGLALVIATAALTQTAWASPEPGLCMALRSFAKSVKPNEKREFTFRTSWGHNFNDDPEEVFFAKRCEHSGFEPAKRVCDYLMKHGATEFSDSNVKEAVACLSRKTRFAPGLALNYGAFSFSYGSDHRGALIDITFAEDEQVGGMAFRLQAAGY